MAVTYGFYNSYEGDRKYDAEQVSSLFDGLIGDGVHESIGGQLLVKSISGMNIKIQTGRAWFNHTWTLNDAEITMAVPAANPIQTRIDAVVLTVDSTKSIRANKFEYVTGTPSASPKRPTLTNTDYVHQHALAYITVNPNVTSITQASITNMVGTSETPFVMSLVQIMSIDDMIAQWQQEWKEWFDAQPGAFEEFVTEFESEMDAWKADKYVDFAEWFENLHYILDDDVAGHLQNEIDQASGSIIHIYVASETLIGKTLTLTGPDTSRAVTIGTDGFASFYGVTDVGELTINVDDSSESINQTITIECFSNYTFTVAPWKAIVNVTLVNEELWGKYVHVTGPTGSQDVKSSLRGLATVTLTQAGTYMFSVEY